MRAAGLKVGQLSLSSRMVMIRSAVPLSSPMSSASSSSSKTGGEKASRSMTTPDLTVTTPDTQCHQPGRRRGKGYRGERGQEPTRRVHGKTSTMWEEIKERQRKQQVTFFPKGLNNQCLGRTPQHQSPGIVPSPGALGRSTESCLRWVTQGEGLTCAAERR